MSKADDIFWRQFGIILGLLILFGFVVAFIARSVAGDAFQSQVNSPSAVSARIAPVGAVRVGDPAQVVAAAPAPAAAAAPAAATAAGDGESVYAGLCAACHMAGVAGAPKPGDVAAWAPRVALGEDALVASVVKGKGAMPPKGGNPALTEDQVRAAVQYLIGTAGGAAAKTVDAARGVAGAAGAAADKATTMAAGAAAKASTMASEAADKVKEMAGQAASSTVAAATAMTASSATAAAPAGRPGDQVYNMGCVACHATGAANAPKLTDKAAWEPRAATGVAALVKNAIGGKGAMPPKGGLASLTDGDVENAVRYMLEQAGVSAAN